MDSYHQLTRIIVQRECDALHFFFERVVELVQCGVGFADGPEGQLEGRHAFSAELAGASDRFSWREGGGLMRCEKRSQGIVVEIQHLEYAAAFS